MRSLAHQVPLDRESAAIDWRYATATFAAEAASPLALRRPLGPAGPEAAAARLGRAVLLAGVRSGRINDRPRRRRPQRDEVRRGTERLLSPGKRQFLRGG